MISDKLLAFTAGFEGCRLQAYQDQVGVWTIGYGHTGDDVYEGLVWTQEQADKDLREGLQKRQDAVQAMVTVDITQNQLDALTDFAYNLGVGALESSFLLKCVNAGNIDAASAQFVKWDHAGGKEVEGLLRRREAERDLFNEA
jgi:lysozyme